MEAGRGWFRHFATHVSEDDISPALPLLCKRKERKQYSRNAHHSPAIRSQPALSYAGCAPRVARSLVYNLTSRDFKRGAHSLPVRFMAPLSLSLSLSLSLALIILSEELLVYYFFQFPTDSSTSHSLKILQRSLWPSPFFLSLSLKPKPPLLAPLSLS